MFEASLEKAALLKKILEAIKELVEMANFECTPSGMQLQAMDSSHVSLVALLLHKDGFSGYRCDRPLQLGIKLPSMAKILKCAGNDDSAVLRCEDGGDTISFRFTTQKNDRSVSFDMKLMEIESDALGVPDTKYSSSVTMPSSEFQRICRDLSTFGEACEICVTKGDVTFSVSGTEGSGKIALLPTTSEDGKNDVHVRCSEPVTLNFALRYLNNFTKATSISDSVTLNMSQDVPLLVEYNIPDTLALKFFLAPKIDEE